ncbi:hypothetical protein [Streptomyces sp. L-9-10]|uniref:hypothetical protein n=1 Tax=Streptomyces sp. L-9-10 TaxID=1478131 RepID=UPI00101CC9F2|nr:hypothetical protein [Streptomyces sp. L-9-10]
MTARVSPVRDRIRKTLKAARTSEPYPVWMTWRSLAVRVYGHGHHTKSDVQNIRRAAEQMSDVEMLRFRDTDKHAGARICPTREERWLLGYVIDVYSDTMNGFDYTSYKPPTSDHILEAFRNGCHQERPIKIDLRRVVALVNKSCGTGIDPSELMWWRVGLEERRQHERRVLLRTMHRALEGFCAEKERREWEARQINFGPVRVDPLTVTECPTCQRSVEPGHFPVQRSGAQSSVASGEASLSETLSSSTVL